MKNPTGRPRTAMATPTHITIQAEASEPIAAITRPTRTRATSAQPAGEFPWLGDSSWVGSFRIRPYASTWISSVVLAMWCCLSYSQDISGSLKLLAMICVPLCHFFFWPSAEHELLRDFRLDLHRGTIHPTCQFHLAVRSGRFAVAHRRHIFSFCLQASDVLRSVRGSHRPGRCERQ